MIVFLLLVKLSNPYSRLSCHCKVIICVYKDYKVVNHLTPVCFICESILTLPPKFHCLDGGVAENCTRVFSRYYHTFYVKFYKLSPGPYCSMISGFNCKLNVLKTTHTSLPVGVLTVANVSPLSLFK